MLDKRSWLSLNGIVIIIASLLFVPAAYAHGNILPQNLGTVLLLLTVIVFPPVLVYLVINLLKSLKPNSGNYISSNRLLKIGFYFLAWGISIIFLSLSLTTGYNFTPVSLLLFLPALPGIILISIGIIKLSALKKASIGIGTGIIVLMIFVFVSYQSMPQDNFVTPPQLEYLEFLGYDARDLNELKAHDGITMLKNSAGIQNNAKEKDERIVIYYHNHSTQPVTISEVRFAGIVFNFQGNVGVIDNYEGTAPMQGNYVILTDGASGLLQSSAELQRGQIVTVVLDLTDDGFIDGRDHQIKITTSKGAIFVGTITIGQQAFQH